MATHGKTCDKCDSIKLKIEKPPSESEKAALVKQRAVLPQAAMGIPIWDFLCFNGGSGSGDNLLHKARRRSKRIRRTEWGSLASLGGIVPFDGSATI